MKFKNNIKKLYERFTIILKSPQMAILPGHMAFFFVLSIVPTVTLIGYGLLLFDVPVDFVTSLVNNVFSKDVSDLIAPILGSVEFNIQFVIILIIGFYIASNGCRALIITSNAVYGVDNTKKINLRIKSIIMTFIIVLLFLFILVVPVYGLKIVDLLKYAKVDNSVVATIASIIKLLKGPITWIMMFITLKIIFTMAPDKKIQSATVNIGSLFTTLLWIITTAIYSFYVSNFARYDLLFAGLSNIVILMLWVYLLAIIFVMGLALNYSEAEKLEKIGAIKVNKKETIKK